MRMLAQILALVLLPTLAIADAKWVELPSGAFASLLKYPDSQDRLQKVSAFALMNVPVSNAQFLEFVQANPSWQRSNAAWVFAEPAAYLSHWRSDLTLGASVLPQQPVTFVSWFAANAYCQAQGARLPTWNEWEYVSAADQSHADARTNPAWQAEILSWYAKPANTALADVGAKPANYYGVMDLHGLVWEWVSDYSAMLVSSDNREQQDADQQKFCGAGALSIEDKQSYAVMMRVAMLSALEGADSTSSLGFRCARDIPADTTLGNP